MTAPVVFDFQPHLTGERLELRPLAPDDFAALYSAAGDPLIWEQHPEADRWREEVFRAYYEGGLASGGALVAIDRASGRVVGSSRYANLTLDGSEIEIGWTFLERAFWGGAYNRELKTLMLDHALRFVERVVFVVGADNLRSQMALLKLGARFRQATERRDRFGRLLPYREYVIDRATWNAQERAAGA